MTRHGADADHIAFQRDTTKARNLIDINECAGLRQAHIKSWHQALAAREDTSFFAKLI